MTRKDGAVVGKGVVPRTERLHFEMQPVVYAVSFS